ncbi:RGS-domain-containing protein [Trichodelitschia bisporula]|uniref:RGS-domain-containing protein n=1 Tax=Trichodelitschia bisporula TaxID=703511 RepID=A0A6G1HTV8_9PEZI|nr:RGS-domain-containing protein [Trichodelitschia bisporula]
MGTSIPAAAHDFTFSLSLFPPIVVSASFSSTPVSIELCHLSQVPRITFPSFCTMCFYFDKLDLDVCPAKPFASTSSLSLCPRRADGPREADVERPGTIVHTNFTLDKTLTPLTPQDFKDLFSTLMVSLPLTPHRVRFQRIDHTFTSEEAVTNLGSLKFSQSNRMPDPKDPSRIVTTTTTTTFSMAKEMARSVCTKFLDARFIESVDGKSDFSSRSAVWQLTPKGMNILQSFCQRNGINQRHVFELLASPRNTMNLVLLEREPDGDKIHRDQATIEVVFRRFAGAEPNVKYSTANSDSDSLSEYQTGMIGVKMAKERKMGDKTHHNTFTGKACVDWLMDCCTVVDRRETHDLAQLFCDYGLMQPIETFGTSAPTRFSPLKSAIYAITEKGQRVAGWIASPKPPMQLNGDASALNGRPREGATRDSNTGRMTIIIRDPALRLLFREFLRDTHCEENLSFFLDVKDFLANYTAAKKESATPRLEVIRETLAAAYSLYNAFLAPGSPCELNIDHTLRTSLAARMTRAVGDDEAMIKSLDEVATLFDQAQNSVFKLMASDSVPKFMREQKYASIIRERGLDVALSAPHIAPPQTVD